jgi:hypothetical protein
MSTASNKIVGSATVTGGSAHDVMNVIRLNDRANTLTLDGRGGADAYNVTFRGPAEPVSGYAIDVVDSGIDAAADVLNIAGSAQADLLRLRASTDPAGFASVASLAGDPAIAQAVNYTKSIASLSIATNGGNDTVLVDDNWAVTTIDGGTGQNTYSVGNLSASAVDNIDNTKVASGQVLSHGVSYQTTINGGDEGDSFTVRRNLAAVTLNGGAGDDAFVVNGFADPSGQPLVNAGVSVDGGGGTANTLLVTGTDFSDTFSITGTNVSGAGISAHYARIQSLTVRAGDGDDTVTVVSTHAGRTTVEGEAGSDTVNVQTISAATTINTGDSADTVNVGSTAPTTGGNVNSIAALLTINGDSGSDTLNVDDTGDSLANAGTLTSTEITGLGMVGKIVYGTFEGLTIGLGSGGDTFTVASTHAGTTALDTNGGGDTVTLETVAGTTTVNTAAGADTVNVRAISAATTINTGDDADTVNVGSTAPTSGGNVNSIAALLTINGDDGSDTLNVDDTGDTLGNTGTLTGTTLTGLGMGGSINYGTLEALAIGLGSGGDTFTVASTHAGTTDLNTNSGGDTVTLETVAGTTTVNTAAGTDTVNVRAISAATTINTGDSADTVNVGSTAPTMGGNVNSIAALLTINGDDGSDTLNVDDTGDAIANTGTLTSTEITGLGMVGKIVYGTFESLTIGLGSGGDTFTVASTHAGTTDLNTNGGGDTVTLETVAGITTVNTAAGSDTVNVRAISAATTINTGDDADTVNVGSKAPTTGGNVNSIAALLTVNGDGGSDTLNVDDTGDTLANTGTLTSTEITGLGMVGKIVYGTFEGLTIGLGSGGDTFTVASTHTGTTDLNTNSGGDTVTLETVAGITTVNTAAGIDTVHVRAISAAATINAGDDADTVNVGSTAPTNGGNVNSIAALLTVNGDGGSDTLNVDDTGDTLANTGTLTGTTLTGLGMGGSINYGTLEALAIGLGSGGDTFTVASTHAGTTDLNTNGGGDTVTLETVAGITTVNTAAGTDTVNVRGISAATTINTGDSADTVNVGSTAPTMGGNVNSIAALLTVNGDDGSDTLNVDDTGDTLANTGTLTSTEITGLGMVGKIVYGTFEGLTIGLGSGGDTFTVASTHAGITDLNTNGGGDTVTLETVAGIATVNTAAGTDTVNVQTISAATTINTGADADTVNVGSKAPTTGGNVNSIAALLTVNGDSGSDTLNVDDTGDSLGNTGTLTGTTLTGLGMVGKIAYGTFEGLTIGLGSGGDTFTVASTHAGTTDLNTNDGADTVSVLSTSGAMTVNAGEGDDVVTVGNGDLDPLQGAVAAKSGGGKDRVYVDDGAAYNTKSVNYRVTPSSVTSTLRTGAAARAFAGLTFDGSTERLSLAGTNVANTFVVVPSQATTFDINGNLPATGTVPPRSGDKLLIDLTTVSDSFLQLSPTVPGSGVWSFGDALPVRFTSIEKFNDSTVAVVSDVGVDSTYGVKVFDAASGILKFEVPAERLYGTTSLVGVRAVMGDLTGDGLADLVVGPNKGIPNAFVRIFDGRDGRLVTELRPYGDLRNHVGGINVAVGDVNGDGWYDLVVSPVGPMRAPIRVFSGEPGHFLEKIGPDLWPMGRSAAAAFTIVVADQALNGPANRGRVFVGSAVNGIATVHSFTLSVNNAWVATAGGRFRPFGNTGRGTPRLSIGDSNADGVQDLIVSRPNDVLGRMRVFDGVKLGIPLGSEFATIPSRQAANDETAFMFDFNGDGRDESIVAFRSTIGVSPAVTRFDATGKVTGGFSTNVSNAKELTGFWLVNGQTAYLSQKGQEISLTYPDGRTAKGLLVGTRYINVPSEKIIGQIHGGTINWNKGRAAWQRVTVTGTYEKDGTLFHVQQQGRLVRVWTDSGEYGSGTIDATGAITPKASSSLLGGTIFDIRWAGGTLGKRFDSAVVFTDSRNRRVRMFETANGDLTFVEASGKAAYGKWIAPGTVQVKDWNGTIGVVSKGSITWNDGRKTWKKF